MAALVAMAMFCIALAGDVTLAWDASQSQEVTGYKIYVGNQSGIYSQSHEAGSVLSYTVSNLIEGNTYYFAATAHDNTGNESGYSNEVSTTIQAEIPFAIKTLAVSMRWFGVVLLCTTSQPASAILRYTDLTTGERQTVISTLESNPQKEHRAILYLQMGSSRYYRYEWTAKAEDGTEVISGGTFQVR